MRGPGLLALAGLLLLAACATSPIPGPTPGQTPRTSSPVPASPRLAVPAPVQPQPGPQDPPPAEALRPLSDLPGWAEEDHAAAFEAWRANCRVRRTPGMAQACRDAFPRPVAWVLWVFAEIAIIATDIAEVVGTAIAPTIGNYGLTLPEFYIENISLPEEVEKVLDKRTSMGLAGDLGKFTQFNAAEGLGNPNSAMGATMGAAMGAGLGLNMGAQAAATAAAPPPPPPVKQWHLAENGATKGPYTVGDLPALVASGSLTRTTQVWTAGQDGWKPAHQTDLSNLFAATPPPPPPPEA